MPPNMSHSRPENLFSGRLRQIPGLRVAGNAKINDRAKPDVGGQDTVESLASASHAKTNALVWTVPGN